MPWLLFRSQPWDWNSSGGHRRDFILGCPLAAAAAILSCKVPADRWIAPHLAVRALFDYGRWDCWVAQPVRCTPLWPASWLPVVDKTRGSKSAEVQRVWEVYDERLQFMSRRDALLLDESLGLDDVSMAWTVWSKAAEAALADAYQFSGGPLPSKGLVLGRGAALFRWVQLGGPWVRRARANAADALDAADVFLYRDFSVAPLLDMRRRFKVVMDLLGAMIRFGVSLSRSVELTAQWDQILALGPMFPVTLDDLSVDRGLGIGAFFDVASDVHRRLSDFIHQVVIHRRDDAIRGWRNWIREDPLVHPYRWPRPDLVPPASFLQCDRSLTPDGSGVLSDPNQIDAEFRKAQLPYFCRSGQRETSLDEFSFEVDGWLPILPEIHLPWLTGQMLADVVLRKGVSAGSLDGWGWRELKALPVSWFDELARILTKVEDLGVWLDGLLDAYIAMIPKTDGNATPLGQRPLCVLPVVYRTWAAARMGQLEGWFKSWVPDSVFSAGGGRGSVEAWYTSALDIEEVLSGATDSQVHLFVADVVKSFDTVDRGILDRVLSSLGLPGWFRHAYFEHHAHVRLRFKLASGLGQSWTRDGGIPQGCPLSMMFIVALYLPWCRYLSAQVGVRPQLYADNLKCLSRDPGVPWRAARFTTGYVRLVGQELAPSKCVLLSTSREVRKDMKDWVLSCEGDQWSVKFDVRDLDGHLDTTFRGWSSTLAARVRLVISRLVLVFVLPLNFHGRVRVVRSMYLPAALHGIKPLHLLLIAFGSLLLMLVLSLAFWMGPLVVILPFVFDAILPFGLLRSIGFIVCLKWLGMGVLGMVLFIFFWLVLLRLVSSGILMPWLGFGLVCLYLVIWLAQFSIFVLLFLMLGVIRLLLTFVNVRVFVVGPFWMFMVPCNSLFLLMFERETRHCFVPLWLVVSGTVFCLVIFVVSLFHVGFVGLLIMMDICSGNVPFLLSLRSVKILSFTIL